MLKIGTLINSISGIRVDGVIVTDADHIPVNNLRQGMLFPEPVNFVTNFRFFRDSFGASAGLQRAEYDLTYTYCHVPIGAGRTGLEYYGGMIEKVGLIMDAIMGIDVIRGAVDVTPADVTEFGAVPDPSGNMYVGCKIILHIVDYIEVVD